MEIKLQKWGNSIGIRIPNILLKNLKLKENDYLEIEEYNGKLILSKPIHLTIEERIEGYGPMSSFEEDIKGIVGNEEW